VAFGLSPLASIARLRSRSFSKIFTFSEKLSEASRSRIFDLAMFSFQESPFELLPL
jgi:hypothetical protein